MKKKYLISEKKKKCLLKNKNECTELDEHNSGYDFAYFEHKLPWLCSGLLKRSYEYYLFINP